MHKNNSFLTIIPARGGSKRLPGKNIKELHGTPLIAWTITAAKKSKYLEKILVSSDDDKILSCSKQYGADVVKRPDELSGDRASSFDAVKHAIETVSEQFDYTVLLQATSPLRAGCHIDEAIELLLEKGADAVVSLCEMEHSPLWCNTLPDDRNMRDFLRSDVDKKRSQDLTPFYRLNGAIYICKTEALLKEKTFILKDKIYAYVMDKEVSIDIDDEFDFMLADFFLTYGKCKKSNA